MAIPLDEKQAKQALELGKAEAATILADEGKVARLIAELEEKAKKTEFGKVLENIPVLIHCLKSYIKREYTEIPVGTILAIVSALLYWCSPIDIVPDVIPGIGHLDDAAVVMVCLTMVKVDLDDYKKWLAAKEVVQEI